ncbi:MAG: hypothetical protein KY454_13100 [Actinobacteria bacterium]|nr:hypothetical protein [Actinomycetota bacterium]MBW3651929.1 hypothetical protein [Actinomycetota bacterium]
MPLPRHLRTLALFAVMACLLAAGCSRAKDGETTAGPTDAPSSETAPPTTVPPPLQFTITAIESNGTQPPDDATVTAVKAALERWAAAAVFAPLQSGQPAPDLSGVFSAPALERLADPAVRATLVDEGLPPASKEITAATAAATLSSVATPDGAVALVAAHLDLRVHAVGPSLDIDIAHLGEFVLVPEGDLWKIESFAMQAIRDSRGD